MLARVPGGVIASLDQAAEAIDLVAHADAANDGDLSSYTPRDPMGWGVKGALPNLNTGHQGRQVLNWVRNAYAKSAAARAFIDRVASDTWGEWVGLVVQNEALRKRLESVCKNPTGRPGDRPIWWWMERSDRLSSRDGKGLLYFILEDATGNPSEAPTRVRGIRGLQYVSAERVLGIVRDDAPDSPTFGQVTHWRILANVGSGAAHGLVSVEVRVHAERVLSFIPEPSEADPEAEGVSLLWPVLNYIAWDENFIWAVAEAYYQEARPLIYARRDPNVPGTFSPESREKVKEELAKIEDPNTQRVVLNGIIVEKLSGAGPSNPLPAWEVVVSHLAMALGIPRRILTGDAAGELAASKEDTRQYAGRISKRQEQYAGPILYAFFDRLIRWEVSSWQRTDEAQVEFTWKPLVEQDALERADVETRLMVARTGYRRNRLPLPEDLQYTPAEGEVDGSWPIGTSEAPAPFTGFGAGAGLDAGGEVPPELAGLVASCAARIEAILQKARQATADYLLKRAAKEARGDAEEDDAARFLEELSLDEELGRLVAELLQEAARRGGGLTLRDLGEEQVFKFIDQTSIRSFRTIGQGLGEDVQRRLAVSVREELAKGLVDGESVRSLASRLEHAFAAGRVDAERIARTEAMRGYNVGTVEALRGLGVEQVRFEAFPDADGGDPQGPCQVLNGHVFSTNDLLARPPIHPNCRCVLVPLSPTRRGDANIRVYGHTVGGLVLLMARRMGVAS